MKTAVRTNFSKFCETYEKYAKVQKETAKILGKQDLIGVGIDLGCGTGFLSQYIKRDFNFIIGIDISINMVQIYQQKGFKGINADIENLPFKEQTFDFAVSNFSLHWTDIYKSFTETFRVLKSGGIFTFSIPVKKSLEEIHSIVGKTFDFEDIDKIYSKLEKAGFKIKKVEERYYPLHFKNGVELIKYFKYTGTAFNKRDNTISSKLKNYKKLKGIENINTGFNVAFFYTIKPF